MNSINNTESASQIGYNNIASGLTATDVQGAVDELAESYPADKVMMSDGVTSVEEALDALTAITIGASIDISSYSTPENLYKCPSDGYLMLLADVAVGNQTRVRFGNGYTLAKSEVAVANHSVITTVYVRKGMQFYCTRAETTYSTIRFLPIS